MQNNYDFESAKVLADDTTNVTQTNVVRDFFAICIKIILILLFVYVSIFFVSGIVIKNMSLDNQIFIENVMSSSAKNLKLIEADTTKEKQIRDKILQTDKNFPKTSNLDIKILDMKDANAFCYPNGNIYITSALKDLLKDDEMLTFIMAHEMAHYKNKDHLMSVRKNVAAASVIILLSAVVPSNKQVVDIAEDVIDLSNLKHSRRAERKADDYAADMLVKIYGNTDGGVRAMKALYDKSYINIEFISTHPSYKNRIKSIKKHQKQL